MLARLTLSMMLLGCGARSALEVDVHVLAEDAGTDPPPVPGACVASVAEPIEIPPRAGEVRLSAAHLGANGARLLVLHGRDGLELLELDFGSSSARPVASFTGSVGTTEASTVAFDAEGRRVGLCGEDGGALRVLDDTGGERTLSFPATAGDCSSVAFADGHWLVVSKEWSTPTPATLVRTPTSLDSIESVALSAPVRSFVSGGPPLFDAGDGLAFVYRPYELDSWPDEALRLQRMDPSLQPIAEPAELIGPELVNGGVWGAAEDGGLFVLFRPQSSSLATGDSPHFAAFSDRGLPRGPPVPLDSPGSGNNFALHATGSGLYWVWIDPGEDFDPGDPASGSQRQLMLQPLSHAGEGLEPPLALHEEPGETAIRLMIESRVEGDRHDLLVAWQGVGVGGGLRSAYAMLVECRR